MKNDKMIMYGAIALLGYMALNKIVTDETGSDIWGIPFSQIENPNAAAQSSGGYSQYSGYGQ